MSMVEQGEEVDIFVDNAADQRNDLGSGTSTTTRLNNKVNADCISIFCSMKLW